MEICPTNRTVIITPVSTIVIMRVASSWEAGVEPRATVDNPLLLSFLALQEIGLISHLLTN